MSKQVVLAAVVAMLSSVVTSAIWTSVTPASASGPSVQVISGLTFADAYSAEQSVDPGEAAAAYATCPSDMQVVGGGYIIKGIDGPAVASAVESYPSKDNATPRYGVEVANPKAASGAVTFSVKAKCVGEKFASVSH